MNIMHRISPLFRRFILVIFNVGALRHACNHVLSREFLAGFAVWVLSAVAILFLWWTKRTLPGLPMVLLVLFSLFTGCCWVLVPVSVYLGETLDRWMRRRISERSWLQTLAGTHLWHQAARGKLSQQFFWALLVGIVLWFAAFQWTWSQTWQAWMVVAFLINALFFVFFPLLLFLQAHIH